MPFSNSPSIAALLLIVTVLAPLPTGAIAHTNAPATEEVSSTRIMATGPLNIVYFRVSGR